MSGRSYFLNCFSSTLRDGEPEWRRTSPSREEVRSLRSGVTIASTQPFGRRLKRVQVCLYSRFPRSLPFGTGRASLGLEGVPLAHLCLWPRNAERLHGAGEPRGASASGPRVRRRRNRLGDSAHRGRVWGTLRGFDSRRLPALVETPHSCCCHARQNPVAARNAEPLDDGSGRCEDALAIVLSCEGLAHA